MSFEAKPIFESDFADSADRFSEAIGKELGDAKLRDTTQAMFESKWLEAIEQGWQACLVPEDQGGLGGSLMDFCALLEAAHRHALRLPVATGFGLPVILLDALSSPAAQSLLARIAQGQARVQLVMLDHQASDIHCAADDLTATIAADGSVTLNGRISGIEQIPGSTEVLLVCPTQSDTSVSVVACFDWSKVTHWQAQAERIDGRTTMSLRFDQSRLSGEQVLASAADLEPAIARTRSHARLFACVGAAGAMGMNIEQTLQYLRDRHQFGVSLSSFQALRHYMSAVYAKYECYRALVRSVVKQSSETGQLNDQELAMLKIYLGQVGQMVAHTVIQVHGGMGMTEDLFASRLNKSILMAGMEYGDGLFHTARVLDARYGEDG